MFLCVPQVPLAFPVIDRQGEHHRTVTEAQSLLTRHMPMFSQGRTSPQVLSTSQGLPWQIPLPRLTMAPGACRQGWPQGPQKWKVQQVLRGLRWGKSHRDA